MATIMRMTPALELVEVSLQYQRGAREVSALDSVTLSVSRGEFLAVTGRSGSGKSSLLHVAGALEKPNGGKVFVDGSRVDNLSGDDLARIRRQHVGFVFQFFNLLPGLTALENAAMPLLVDGARLREIADGVRSILEEVGLESRVDHRPGELSGGEMQRVAIARALVANPALVLADEPTGNLDSRTAEEVLEVLVASTVRRDRTLVLVTHDRAVAREAGRTVELCDGRLSGAG